jgi:hypothetical protein
MLKEGLAWGILSSILLPAGFMGGTAIRQHVLKLKESSPRLLYGGSAISILVFVVLIALSISGGR